MPDTTLSTGNPAVPSARVVGDALVVTLRGEVDLTVSPTLRATLFELIATHAPKRLILDLAAVPYMDSSAIAVMVEVLRRLRGGKVVLVALQPRVRGLLEIARLHTIFSVADTQDDALNLS